MMEKEAYFMAIRYKVDILAELKKKGYSSTRIREEKLIGQSYLQQLRRGELVSWKILNIICSLLECQPGDLIEYVEKQAENTAQV
jgi:putative transcriptional regulator